MISRLLINDIPVYITRFTDREMTMPRHDGERHAVGRLLRYALGHENYSHRADGSPYIEGLGREITVSHCKGIAAIAVGASVRIGLDIERMRPTLHRVRRKYLSAEEMNVCIEGRDLLAAWTVKEAVYKAAAIRGLDFSDDICLPDRDGVSHVAGGGIFHVTTVVRCGYTLSLAIP